MAEVYVGRKFKTVLVEGENPDGSLVDSLLEVAHSLDGMGLTPENAGNMSVRTKRGMLITIGGKNKGELDAEDIVEVISFDGESANVVGSQEPSSETPMHWQIYRKYPLVDAVIHVHDDVVLEKTGILGLSVTGETNYGTGEQAHMVLEKLDEGDYVVIKDHGIVSVGENLEKVFEKVVGMHKHASMI